MPTDNKYIKEFLSNFCNSTGYQAQVINNAGFIDASSDPQKIGSFHETGYQLLNGSNSLVNQHAEKTEDGLFALYTPLVHNNTAVGLLEIVGEEKNARIYSRVMKLSIETMISHGVTVLKFQKYNSKFDLFIQKLFYDSQATPSELETRASTLGYLHDCMRIPVFIVTKQYMDMSELLHLGRTNPMYNPQDMIALSRSGNITLLIYLGYGEEILRNYREIVTEYLKWWQDILQSLGLEYYMQVGSIQNRLSYYQRAYNHAVWLHNSMGCREQISWFYDYTELYLKNMIPLIEYRSIFQAFADNLSPEFLESYTQLIGCLSDCNYNLQPASQKLFIHKNTLTFRLGKIKEHLNINPMQNIRNREFANNLCFYLKMLHP